MLCILFRAMDGGYHCKFSRSEKRRNFQMLDLMEHTWNGI
jgi:hypothetical protein